MQPELDEYEVTTAPIPVKKLSTEIHWAIKSGLFLKTIWCLENKCGKVPFYSLCEPAQHKINLWPRSQPWSSLFSLQSVKMDCFSQAKLWLKLWFLLYHCPLSPFNHLQAWKVYMITELILAKNNSPSSLFPTLMSFLTSLTRLPVNSWTTQAKDAVGAGMTGQEAQELQPALTQTQLSSWQPLPVQQWPFPPAQKYLETRIFFPKAWFSIGTVLLCTAVKSFA